MHILLPSYCLHYYLAIVYDVFYSLHFNYIYLHLLTHLTYLECYDWGSSRRKYICLLTSPLCHALQS